MKDRIKKKPKSKHKSLKTLCDSLWAECVKARAGYRCELSGVKGRQIGGETILHAHHIFGKGTYRLRYEIDNGICLSAGIHKFGVHNQSREQLYTSKIIKAIGKKRYDKIKMLGKYNTGGSSLALVEIYLKSELKRLAESLALKQKQAKVDISLVKACTDIAEVILGV